MSEVEKPAGEGRISRHNTITRVDHQSGQCYFRPDTEEMVFIAGTQAGAFEKHWQEMLAHMDQFHQANAGYSSALERYARGYSGGEALSLALENQLQAVAAAEDELAQKRKALQERLGSFSLEGMSYDEVVELLPVGDTRKNGKGKSKAAGRRYVYVKKAYYDQSEKKRGLHKVSLKAKDKRGAKESIYSRDQQGRARIDTDKLKQQLTTLEWPKLKLELKDVAQWVGLEEQLERVNTQGELFDWAKSWNESLHIEREWGANVDVSAGAQFMRYASNVGASAEFDPDKGQASFKGEGKASLSLATATANLTAYVPDRLGWPLSYTNSHGQLLEMGMLRLYISPALTGFIGASVLIEGQLQVVLKGDQQLLAGQPEGRLPRFRERKTRGAVFHQQMDSQDEGLSLSGEAFAGARAEGSFKGGLQWLKPSPPPDLNGSVINILKSSGEFTDFCSISGSIAGLAGVGAGGKFHCTFINGKFRFHVAASLCWGVGAKGGLICEVGVNTIAEFGAWLVYQLYRLNYSFFDVVKEDAFRVYSQFCVMQMEELISNIYESYGAAKVNVADVADRFVGFIQAVSDENKKSLDASKRRNRLAENINVYPERMLSYTPEAKGILLYLLTRHGTWDIFDPGNRGDGLVPDLYQQRKAAVICVLRSIQTRAEWRKVLCRMTPDGVSMSQDDNELAVAEQQERYLVNFLQLGFNRDQDLHRAKGELTAIYDRLKTDVAWGYALAMNDTGYYQCNIDCHPHYPQRCAFGPCDAEPSQLA